MQSGTKLVLGIFGLAVLAGVLSWWYRYETAHRSTTFWGPHFAELIAKPSNVSGFGLKEQSPAETNDDLFVVLNKSYWRIDAKDLTSAPGMVHLRNSILSDGNYRWEKPAETDDWRWSLQFSGDGRKATLLFNEDFTVLGRMNQRASEVRTVDCSPMSETLREYFSSIDAFETGDASKPAE